MYGCIIGGRFIVKKDTRLLFICVLVLSLFFVGCDKADTLTGTGNSEATDRTSSIKVSFIELGSINCVPCKMMQPVMEQLEENFPNHLEVIFYDVWTEEDKHRAAEYDISVIPVQVFPDSEGKEFFRHEGFFPYEEVVEILKRQGVTD